MDKILFIRFSSIGDIVLTTPVIRCVKRQLEGVQVHFLTRETYRPLIQANPFIDRIFTIHDRISEVLPQLQQERYRTVVDLHRNFRSAGVAIGLRKKPLSFPKLNLRKWILVNMRMDLMPPLHVVDRYFHAVRSLGVTNDGQGLDYFIAEEDRITLGEIRPDYHGKYIIWAIGGRHGTKIFPVHKIVPVCRRLKIPVVLLGDAGDFSRGEFVARESGSHVWNACGKLTIGQSASLIEGSFLVITNDTGLMHISAALGKRIISLWGNTVPAFGMFPYLPGEGSRIMEVKGLPCRPCSKIGFDKCPKGHFNCMEMISGDEIVKEVESSLV
ncbi:MAG: glycosyltransferase family 9 protein [Bacteroidales bacterium]|nr:glycosyltransferase family 9 protein [Bacteroidales bacterium]